jgi:hypothetical protein
MGLASPLSGARVNASTSVCVAMTSAPFPRQILVVCEREMRTHARNLVRAASTYQSIEWCFDTEFESRVSKGPGSRTIFIGDSKYAKFLRGLSKPVARQHGAVWSLYKQHALIYVEDVIIDVRSTLPKVRDQIEQLKIEAAYQAESVSYHEGVIEGPLVAHQYFQTVEVHPSIRADNIPIRERDVKRAFIDNQTVLGIAWFLMEGWDDLINGPETE